MDVDFPLQVTLRKNTALRALIVWKTSYWCYKAVVNTYGTY
jgi:hypothetical protein